MCTGVGVEGADVRRVMEMRGLVEREETNCPREKQAKL
jgi:hypothetical protein